MSRCYLRFILLSVFIFAQEYAYAAPQVDIEDPQGDPGVDCSHEIVLAVPTPTAIPTPEDRGRGQVPVEVPSKKHSTEWYRKNIGIDGPIEEVPENEREVGKVYKRGSRTPDPG